MIENCIHHQMEVFDLKLGGQVVETRVRKNVMIDIKEGYLFTLNFPMELIFMVYFFQNSSTDILLILQLLCFCCCCCC